MTIKENKLNEKNLRFNFGRVFAFLIVVLTKLMFIVMKLNVSSSRMKNIINNALTAVCESFEGSSLSSEFRVQNSEFRLFEEDNQA